MTSSKTSWLKSAAKKWSTFQHLPPEQRRQLTRALCLYPATALSLRFFGFLRTQQLLQAMPTFHPQRSLEQCDAQTIAQLSSTAANLIPLYPPRCLIRSLVCSRLLQTNSFTHKLRIGVRKNGARFQAHAWIEYPQSLHNLPDTKKFTTLF